MLLALFDRMQAEGLPPDSKALTLAILAADQVRDRGPRLVWVLEQPQARTLNLPQPHPA